MSEELKPCPVCHGKELSRESYGDEVWIECLQCGIRGPSFKSPIVNDILAEKAWNTLPRAPHITPNEADCKGCPERRDQCLVWTDKPPTVPGWYWYIQRGSYLPCIIQLVYLDFDTDRLKALFAGIEDDEYVEDMDGWWAGHIPMPQKSA